MTLLKLWIHSQGPALGANTHPCFCLSPLIWASVTNRPTPQASQLCRPCSTALFPDTWSSYPLPYPSPGYTATGGCPSFLALLQITFLKNDTLALWMVLMNRKAGSRWQGTARGLKRVFRKICRKNSPS